MSKDRLKFSLEASALRGPESTLNYHARELLYLLRILVKRMLIRQRLRPIPHTLHDYSDRGREMHGSHRHGLWRPQDLL